ncbi:MAG: discoidin domain-containing protein, partial [Candidatus Binatia bacterium]
PSSRKPPCLRGDWDVRASTGVPEVSVAGRAVDGDRSTRWGTGEPQRPGQFFEIDFGEERLLGAIELDLGEFRTDYPRGLRAAVSRDGRSWSTVFVREPWLGEVAWADGFAFHDGGESGRVRIPLGGAAARWLKLEQTRTTSLYDWSIAEICVRGG